jgi:hypothetical protein
MRIIGEFDAGQIKVTVFKMNERISLKMETGLMEQTYKFRDGSGIENFADAQRFCSHEFIHKVNDIFTTMALARKEGFDQLHGQSDPGDIIL